MHIPNTAEVIGKLKAGNRPPRAAMRVFGEPVTLNGEPDSDDLTKSIKVNLKARQRGPIEHYWWGKVYHDLGSMRSKEKVALDDTHDAEIGYARPRQTEYGLELSGVVVPNKDNPQHPANRIAYNLRNGIPQEASIDFSGDYDVVEVPEGMSMPVNGGVAEGPCMVIQNWPLRAVAICKEGADSSTMTESMSAEESPLPRTITIFSQPKEEKQKMAEPIPAVPAPVEAPKPEEAPVIPPPAPPEPVPGVEPAKQAQQTANEIKALKEQLAKAEGRIEALSKPSVPPIPSVPTAEGAINVNEPKTWGDALKALQSENPHLQAESIVRMASEKYPELRATASTFGYRNIDQAKKERN